MSSTIRKNITLSEEDYLVISDFCQKIGKSFSEVLRTATLSYIEKIEKENLAEFLFNNVDFVSEEEQKEFEKIMVLDDENDKGVELDLKALLKNI